MAELVQAGKARFLGLSEASEATIEYAAAVDPIAVAERVLTVELGSSRGEGGPGGNHQPGKTALMA